MYKQNNSVIQRNWDFKAVLSYLGGNNSILSVLRKFFRIGEEYKLSCFID